MFNEINLKKKYESMEASLRQGIEWTTSTRQHRCQPGTVFAQILGEATI